MKTVENSVKRGEVITFDHKFYSAKIFCPNGRILRAKFSGPWSAREGMVTRQGKIL